MSIYWSPCMYILSSITPRCVYRYTCICIYMPMSKYRCIGKYINLTDVYKTYEYICDALTQIYSHTYCSLVYMCLYVPIHTSHVHVSELINLCPWHQRDLKWLRTESPRPLLPRLKGLKQAELILLYSPLSFLPSYLIHPLKGKIFFSSAKIPKCS